MSYNIGIVDDSEDILEFLSMEFEDYEVKTFLGGQTLLGSLSKGDFTPDALIVDYVMPDMSGIELIQTLKMEGDTTPIVVLTGGSDKSIAMSCLKYGVFALLEKPCNGDIIRNTVLRSIFQQRSMVIIDQLLTDFQQFISQVEESSKHQFDRTVQLENLLFQNHVPLSREQKAAEIHARKHLRLVEKGIKDSHQKISEMLVEYEILKAKVV